jgi:hypothetical protein
MSFVGNALNNIAFTRINIVTVTSNGTYTKPDDLRAAQVVVIGGGGGSGGMQSTGSGQVSLGGAGGGGATAIKVFSYNDLSATTSITIGAGGAGGVAGFNPGSAGGTTIFSSSTPVEATGGAGGASIAGSINPRADVLGAAGGTATGGDINVTGGHSGASFRDGTGAQDPQIYGSGGTSLFCGQSGYADPAAQAPTGFGGGAGARTRGGGQPNTAGVDGFQGAVIITEYLAEPA